MAISFLWPWYWFLIVAILGTWITVEVSTRHGNFHYNSENGFSPLFNRFVGSGTYLGLQTLLYLILKIFFGESVYCLYWPYAFHVIVFASSGLLLHLVGFWPYLKDSNRGKRRYR
jgi:hypothetical protein